MPLHFHCYFSFQRDGNETVPGCSGFGLPNVDYCYDYVATLPDDALAIVVDDDSPAELFPLALCRGDCDFDADCMGSYKCFQRNESEPVPGCTDVGEDDVGVDYCYDAGSTEIPALNELTVVGEDGLPSFRYPLQGGSCDLFEWSLSAFLTLFQQTPSTRLTRMPIRL